MYPSTSTLRDVLWALFLTYSSACATFVLLPSFHFCLCPWSSSENALVLVLYLLHAVGLTMFGKFLKERCRAMFCPWVGEDGCALAHLAGCRWPRLLQFCIWQSLILTYDNSQIDHLNSGSCRCEIMSSRGRQLM